MKRNSIFQSLKKRKLIIEEELKYFTYKYKKDTNFGKMYLLPKIQKRLINVPGRPVISNCGTPTEKASEFLDHHLQPIMRSGMSYIKVTNDFLLKLKNLKEPNSHTTSNPHRFDVDFMLIRRRPNFDEFQRHFHVFFDVISSLVKKSTLFPRTFFDVISMVEKSTLFPLTFFDVISMAEKSTLFLRTFFDVISLVEISTLFLLTFFETILMGKNLASFLVTCKLMKTFEEIFLCL